MLIYTLPFIGALTGWITNFLAIKMLFHPRKEKKILFIKFQGIFPKRQKVLAEKLGQLVANELFSANDIKAILRDPEILSGVKAQLDSRVDEMLKNFIAGKPMLAMFIKDSMLAQIKEALVEQIEKAIPEMMDGITNKIDEKVDIEKIVFDKVTALSTDEIEKLLYGIMAQEFKFIELVGAILGFLIGCTQVLLVSIR